MRVRLTRALSPPTHTHCLLRSYGGLDATGALLTDMWAFSRTDKAWTAVSLTGVPLPTQVSMPAGAFLGSIFYVSLSTPVGAALYRVKPCFDCAPTSSGGAPPAGSNAGLIAGLVVGGGVLAAAGAFVVLRRPQWLGQLWGAQPGSAAGGFFTSLGETA